MCEMSTVGGKNLQALIERVRKEWKRGHVWTAIDHRSINNNHCIPLFNFSTSQKPFEP